MGGAAGGGILGFAFLPVFYSHLALNDVPTLAPVALSLYGVAGVLRHGRMRDYAIAGIGIGLAAATKYTGLIMLVCLLAASLCDGLDGSGLTAARRCGLALVLALVSFVVANPYSVLDPSSFFSGVGQQASEAAGSEQVKLGSNPGSGIDYYLWTFTWGLGWGPTIAALGGSALLLVRRRLAMALVLLPAPIVFIVFMGDQQRFFGRWLMPIFPIVAVLGAYGAVELARALSRARGAGSGRALMPAALAGTIVAVLLLGQSVAADVHNDQVLSRPDTRNLARAWMVNHVPAGAKIVLEPMVPDNWALDIGRVLPVTSSGERWRRFPTWLTNLDPNLNPLPPGQSRYVFVDQYERYLRPELLDQYTSQGYCWVVLGSLQAGRAFAQPGAAPRAIAYYAALARRAKLVYQINPFGSGDHPVPFSFDWSIDYYPRQYRLPGPELGIYHLSGGSAGRRRAEASRGLGLGQRVGASRMLARGNCRASGAVSGLIQSGASEALEPDAVTTAARPEAGCGSQTGVRNSASPSYPQIGMTLATEIDHRHLARAIELAEQGRGQVSPNPLVGAVIGRRRRDHRRGLSPRARRAARGG